MKEIDYRNGECTVFCDANMCNKTLDVNSNQYRIIFEINYEMKDNGWLARKMYDRWYDFCSEECYHKTLAELKKKMKGD